jgi:hypothetical protein
MSTDPIARAYYVGTNNSSRKQWNKGGKRVIDGWEHDRKPEEKNLKEPARLKNNHHCVLRGATPVLLNSSESFKGTGMAVSRSTLLLLQCVLNFFFLLSQELGAPFQMMNIIQSIQDGDLQPQRGIETAGRTRVRAHTLEGGAEPSITSRCSLLFQVELFLGHLRPIRHLTYSSTTPS